MAASGLAWRTASLHHLEIAFMNPRGLATLLHRACLKENSSLHISSMKFLNDLFTKKFYFSEWPLLVIYTYKCKLFISATVQTIINAQTAFHHCTFQVITAHFKSSLHVSPAPSYAEATKMKWLTLHTNGCLRASLRECSSSFFGDWICKPHKYAQGYNLNNILPIGAHP